VIYYIYLREKEGAPWAGRCGLYGSKKVPACSFTGEVRPFAVYDRGCFPRRRIIIPVLRMKPMEKIRMHISYFMDHSDFEREFF